MSETLHLKIIYPFSMNIMAEEDLPSGLDDFLELSGKLSFQTEYLKETFISISHLETCKPISDPYKGERNALVFEATVNIKDIQYNQEVITSYGSPLSNEELFEFYLTSIRGYFKRKVFYVLVLNQVASPGWICLGTGDVYFMDKLFGSAPSIKSILQEVYNEIKTIGWPKLQILPFMQVWDWFNKHGLDFEKHSTSKTGTALNAFTHIFDDHSRDTVLELLWAMVGIEALYATSKDGIAEQIFTKSQILLGEMTDFKKKLKEMYNFRSRFFHGDLNIPPAMYEFYDAENEDYSKKLSSAAFLAIAILTATLQKMIILDKPSLKFKTELE